MKKFINLLCSTYFLVAVLVVLVITLIGGSLLPLDQAVKMIYSSPAFKTFSFVLLALLLLCLFSQFRALTEKRIFLTVHVALVIILIGGFISAFFSCKGLLKLYVDETSHIAIKENNSSLKLPFDITLRHFDVEKYKQHPDITLKFLDKNFETIKDAPVLEAAEIPIPQNTNSLKIVQISQESDTITNILIDINGFKRWVGTNTTAYLLDEDNKIYVLFLCEPNKNVKSYKSLIEIVKDNKNSYTSTIEVNKPFTIDGYKLYQHSYDKENRNWSGILVKKDPGVGVVFFGYLVLVLGILLNLFKTFTTKEGADV